MSSSPPATSSVRPPAAAAPAAASTSKSKKKPSKAAAAAKHHQQLLEAEQRRLASLHQYRWTASLECLQTCIPVFRSNPWLMLQEPKFIHRYLDALTEVLSHLSQHESELQTIRSILQDVYEAFVDVGKFTKYQPSFYLDNPHTMKRFVRLLEQVAHRGSDKALFPNVLSMLGPTFEREELYDMLAENNIQHSLLSFARNDWLPTPSTLSLLLAIIEQLSQSPRLRQQFEQDPGFEKLQKLAYGTLPGFSREQQMSAQQSLANFTEMREQVASQQVNETQQLLAKMNLDPSLAVDMPSSSPATQQRQLKTIDNTDAEPSNMIAAN